MQELNLPDAQIYNRYFQVVLYEVDNNNTHSGYTPFNVQALHDPYLTGKCVNN